MVRRPVAALRRRTGHSYPALPLSPGLAGAAGADAGRRALREYGTLLRNFSSPHRSPRATWISSPDVTSRSAQRRSDHHFDGEETAAAIEPTAAAYVAPTFEIPTLTVTPPKIPQPYVVEIWVEKSDHERRYRAARRALRRQRGGRHRRDLDHAVY